MTHLLDGNVLVAMLVADHPHYERTTRWFAETDHRVASCPITQGTLVRILVRNGLPGPNAVRILTQFIAHTRHDFWPDRVSYERVSLAGVIGHRQVTDAYLAGLARANEGRVATLDRGLAQLHADVVDLLPE